MLHTGQKCRIFVLKFIALSFILGVLLTQPVNVKGATFHGFSSSEQDSTETSGWIGRFPFFFTPSPTLSSLNPASDMDRQSPNVFLQWQVATNGLPVVGYRVYLEADTMNPKVLLAETTATHLDPPTLELARDYSWQVVAVDSNDVEYPGPVWTFRTEGAFDASKIGEMVAVPAGEFRMGCDESNPLRPFSCYEREKPVHTVYLNAFEIDKYETTNAEYRACVEANACNSPRRDESYTREPYFSDLAYSHYPVLYVSWWDANDYCRWKGKRLPTEAEWEKAARGPIDTRAWPWGHERIDCTRANMTDDTGEDWTVCVGDTTQVGAYPTGASPYGAMDMSGNVFEWVADAWELDYYHESPYDNPTGPDANTKVGASTLFVLRGGSYRPRWFYPQTNHRKAGHHGDAPYYRNDQVGFRCARSLELEPIVQ